MDLRLSGLLAQPEEHGCGGVGGDDDDIQIADCHRGRLWSEAGEAYRKVGRDLELVMIGPPESYYRDLKQYLKNR